MAQDSVLEGALDLAREVAKEAATGDVGEHLGFYLEGDRLGTHRFATLNPGYVGWHWAVTLSRAPRSRTATVCEVELLPGKGALLAPEWVPWSERLRPGDVGPNDTLPFQADDGRLMQGYEQTGDDDADRMAVYELGLGRARVLSPEGRAAAFTRWYEGDQGPKAAAAKHANGQCSTCGFFLKLAGTGRTIFGVCANEWSPSDGSIVSVDHGCGAHSETDVRQRDPEWQQSEPIIDHTNIEVVTAYVPGTPVAAATADADQSAPAAQEPETPAADGAAEEESPAEEVPATGGAVEDAPVQSAPKRRAPAKRKPAAKKKPAEKSAD